jgi:multiple sugar transport system ATP-binding protein
MMQAVLIEDGRSFALQIAENRIPIPENKAPADVLRSYVGKEVIAGIRAENISDDPNYFESMNLPVLNATVDMMEMLGAEVYLTLDCANMKLTAKVPSHTKAKLDSQIRIGLEVNRLHLFDKETELTIFN